MNQLLPTGQREINDFPRFGLSKFADRFPDKPDEIAVDIGGDIAKPFRLSAELGQLERVEQVSDFHCVTTWTKRNVAWGEFGF